jgi:hypothetical protein
MGQQQLLLVIVGVIIVGLAIAVGISLFSAQSVAYNRDAMINDLNHVGQLAYQYRITLQRLGGGEGKFVGFVIPSQMATNSNASYSVLDAQINTVIVKGVSVMDSTNTITVTVNNQGKLTNLIFSGDFQ